MLFYLTVKDLFRFVLLLSISRDIVKAAQKCAGNGHGLKYLSGDALTDSSDCVGPNNAPYPSSVIQRAVRSLWSGNSRTGRAFRQNQVADPEVIKRVLLENYQLTREDVSMMSDGSMRNGRSFSTKETCGVGPSKLCKTRYNTTAPMYGVSLTSGQPVTIVQKFPDLLQQVVFEVCESKECDVVHGECTQTYVPYLFLVIPLGPVTLTGQDYVLVESGCVCKPKNSMMAVSETTTLVPNL